MPYKDELKQQILDILQQFFREEQNNRITSFNMAGLTGALTMIFDKNKMQEGDQK